MMKVEEIKNNKINSTKKKIELNNRTGIFCALHTALQWNSLLPFLPYIEEIEKKKNRKYTYI